MGNSEICVKCDNVCGRGCSSVSYTFGELNVDGNRENSSGTSVENSTAQMSVIIHTSSRRFYKIFCFCMLVFLV